MTKKLTLKAFPMLTLSLVFSACATKVVRDDVAPQAELKVDFDIIDATKGCNVVHIDDTLTFGAGKAVIKTETAGTYVMPWNNDKGIFEMRRFLEVPSGSDFKKPPKLSGESTYASLDVQRQVIEIYQTNLKDSKVRKPYHCRAEIRIDDFEKVVTWISSQGGVKFNNTPKQTLLEQSSETLNAGI